MQIYCYNENIQLVLVHMVLLRKLKNRLHDDFFWIAKSLSFFKIIQ
jgi:hypothetical protein